MAIRDGLNKSQLLIALAAIFILCVGCGSDEEPIVEPDTTKEPETTVEPDTTVELDVPIVEADPVISVEPPEDQAEEVEEVLATIRGLVLDQVTKDPLIGVSVQLTDGAGVVLETLTSALGVFEFEGVAPNPQLTLTIESDEHEKLELPLGPVRGVEHFDLQLNPLNPDQLPEGDGLIVGAKAPAFNLSDSDGEMIALADYAGQKKVVLVFDRGEF